MNFSIAKNMCTREGKRRGSQKAKDKYISSLRTEGKNFLNDQIGKMYIIMKKKYEEKLIYK